MSERDGLHPEDYDQTHISPRIREDLPKLGPEKSGRVRDVADRNPYPRGNEGRGKPNA